MLRHLFPKASSPLRKRQPLSPHSPYAVSKIAQEMLGIQYARGDGLPVYLTRSFNHTGPRQKETFRVLLLCAANRGSRDRRAAHFEILTRQPGSAHAIFRTCAMWSWHTKPSWKKAHPGVPYNVCSGPAISIENVLNTLLSYSNGPFKVVRSSLEIPAGRYAASAGKREQITQATPVGKPTYPIEKHACAICWITGARNLQPGGAEA